MLPHPDTGNGEDDGIGKSRAIPHLDTGNGEDEGNAK